MPATRDPVLGAARAPRPAELGVDQRPDVAGERLELAGAGGSVVRWRSVWRTVPACSEAWKPTSAPTPTTSSVEPPPMSTTSVFGDGGALGAGAEIGEPRLLGAVEDVRVEARSARAARRGKRPVRGVADGAGGDRAHALGPSGS